MKKLTLLLTTILVCFIGIHASAQVSLSNYTTYNLEVIPFSTDYQNILTEKDIHLNFNNLTQLAADGDLYIRVNFISGLKSNYLLQTAIPGTGFAYRSSYTMPIYRVSIIDKNGNLILQKIYGGEKREAVFGEFASISSPEDLKFEWEANRIAFYKNLESNEEEPIRQEMDDELAIAVQRKAQEIATGIVQEPEEEMVEEERKITHTGKPRKNIYKPNTRNPRPQKAEDPSEPKLSPNSAQIFDLNGFIEVAACSKYSYQLVNNHPTATLTVYLQKKPEEDPQEVILGPGEGKFFRGLPHKQSWIMATYLKEDFQGDQILLKENLNLLGNNDRNPRVITDLLDQYFEQVQPQIVFAPVFDTNDEVIGYESENNQWRNSLKTFLAAQTVATINKSDQNSIVDLTEEWLGAKALRTISEKIEQTLDTEDGNQKLIYPIIKGSKNFRNVTPLLSLEFSQSLSVLGSGINGFWDKPSNSRASISFRLPFEWQLNKRKSGSYSTVHIRASYESLTLDFNREIQAFAVDPGSAFEEPEPVIPDEQFALQTTQLGAGLAWKFYFPLPIIEIEGGAFFSHKTRLLWGQDRGQFPRSIFSPENEIIPNVVNLSSFRPYFGGKIAIPFYFSGYKFGCDTKLSNVQVFAGFRMYPVNFTESENYNVFIQDAALIDFIPIPLQEGQSKFLMHLTVGGAVEF